MSAPLDPREADMLDASVSGLRRMAPELSADVVATRRQRIAVLVVLVVLAAGLVADWLVTLRIVLGLITLFYAAALVYRLLLVRAGLREDGMTRVSDADARAVADDDLPVYSVLVPAYNEPEVIAKVIDAVSALEYPRHRLDVRLLLEADDHATVAAARAALAGAGDDAITIVLVPPAEPRTKPKACNYGLLTCRGELVTIYDAEDRPEPLQLRRAVVALDRLGPRFACVQARLGYFNAQQNFITRWFAIEYANWFGLLLPGLRSLGAPIPLGGTSNHFRTSLLRRVGAWDAFNVTEDADLGMRLARLGYSVGVLDSQTAEEANSDFVNWVKQRSRWYKGYLQTWLVHMRRPIRTHRELGFRGALGLHFFVGATPLIAAANPVFWLLTVMWYDRRPDWLAALYPPETFYLALACFVVGNFAVVYINVLTTRLMGGRRLLLAALTVPAYWAMMSVAAIKAVVQLIRSPFYWEKTAHGLDGAGPADAGAAGAPGADADPDPLAGAGAEVHPAGSRPADRADASVATAAA